MNPARCPDCGTKRDASFTKRDGQCVAVQCIACETSHPCCPECRTPKIKRADNQLDLECVFCEGTFPDPKIPRSSRKEPSQKDIHFLVEVGQGLSASDSFRYRKGRRSIRLRSPQRYEEEQGAEFSKLGYINSELRRFVVLPNLIGWIETVRSTRRANIKPDLLAVSYVSGNLLADNSSLNHPTESIQYRRAKQLLDVIMIAARLRLPLQDNTFELTKRYSKVQIAKLLDVSRWTVARMIDRGDLKPASDGKVTGKALNEYLESTYPLLGD